MIYPHHQIDNDSDEEQDQVVPVLQHIDNAIGESSRSVQRELFPNAGPPVMGEGSTTPSERRIRQSQRAGEADDSDMGSLITWDRFQQ